VRLPLVFVPPTYLLPHVAGGLVFGVGFVVGGLCPGTSCVSASTGRLDGVAVLVGMVLGTVAFNEAFPLVETLYRATPRGPLTIPQALGLPHGVVVTAVVTAALLGFAAAERIERRGTGAA
jgi:uncharacterized membrane protein YedE/YeeE